MTDDMADILRQEFRSWLDEHKAEIIGSAKPTRRATAKKATLPSGLNLKAWDEYIRYRREAKHKKLTARSEELAATKLIADAPGMDLQQQAINQTIASGWQGIFPQRSHNETGNQTPAKTRNELHREAYAEFATTGRVDSRDIREDENSLRSVMDEASRREQARGAGSAERMGQVAIELHW